MVAFSSSDPLKRTPPSEYVEALTGEEVPPSGFIHCPLHADRTPHSACTTTTGGASRATREVESTSSPPGYGASPRAGVTSWNFGVG
jgi:hypothetical protein